MKNSRTKNAYMNMIVSLSVQVAVLGMNYAARIIFVKVFGETYLGINGLYSNLISVLSMADLGIGGAMIYSLYSPVARGDEHQATVLLNFYRTCYQIVGISVGAAGLILIPFLKYIINMDVPVAHSTFYYLLFLTDTVSSYFFVYKTSIFNADQRYYKIKIYYFFFSVLRFTAQLLIALYWRNFTAYLFAQIIFSISFNYYCSKRADKEYPYIKNKEIKLGKDEKRTIWQNIKAMMTYQVGGVLLNNTDGILISIFAGTVMVGYYSNYVLIVSAVSTFTEMIFTSLQSSIGNLNATESREKKYRLFLVLEMISFWVYGFSTICIYSLSQDFIYLSFGASYQLGKDVLFVVAANFYIKGILSPVYCYRNTVGLFKQTKNIMLYTCMLNLVLSIAAGEVFGLVGILAATGLARLLTNFWYEPFLLYKLFFHEGVKEFYKRQCFFFLILIASGLVIHFIAECLPDNGSYISFFMKCLFCFFSTNIIIAAVFHRTDEFAYVTNSFKSFLGKYKVFN